MKNDNNLIDTKDNSDITILPLEVDNILNYKVQIIECHARNDIREIIIKNDYLSIAELIKMISDGYDITACNFKQKLTPPFKQLLLIDYYYGNNPNFKQELKDKNIFPTFIIEHDQGSDFTEEHTAVLGYCFNEPIDSPQLATDIFNSLGSIFHSLVECYNAYDWGNITNLTISNNVYVPVKGDVSYGE